MSEMAKQEEGTRSFCTFRLGERLYGMEVGEVREVSVGLAMTPVPHAPAEVRGLANLRSRIYLVLDVRVMLGLARAEVTSESRLVILRKSVSENTAVLVDERGDIVSVPVGAIEKAPEAMGEGAGPALVTGICKLERELLMVVAAGRLVDHVKNVLSQEGTRVPGNAAARSGG